MQIAVFLLLIVVLLGFGIGYAVLSAGGGLYRGSGSGARATVGVLIAGCIFLTLRELQRVDHPHGYAENYAGLFDFILAVITGAAGLGLLVALLFSLRAPPVVQLPSAIRNSEASTERDATPALGTREKKGPSLWRN